MKLIMMLLMAATMNTITLYDFNKNSNPRDWKIVDDVVMGGRSNGNFTINSEGKGVFSGSVSIENNGGFSSVRYETEKIKTAQKSTIVLRVKGDGKSYQLRIKDRVSNYYSYITEFQTSGNWETINIPLGDLYPSFRGRRLNMPNFNSDSFEEIAFLIGNKKNESFTLMFDTIELK